MRHLAGAQCFKFRGRNKMRPLHDPISNIGAEEYPHIELVSATIDFFLECGARANKIRVYEMVGDPVAREMVGYLRVRGGVHIVAWPDLPEEPRLTAPTGPDAEIDPTLLADVAKRLYGKT